MKNLLLVAFLFVSLNAFSQNSDASNRTEEYCMVVANSKAFSSKVLVTLDYGQETTFFGGKRQTVNDEDGKPKEFNSVVDALNYMNGDGWEVLNAYSISVGNNQNVYHYLMKRDID